MKPFSTVAAGSIRWGSWGSSMSTDKMSKFIETCIDNGIYTIDASDVYGNYTTEGEIGQALKLISASRDSYHIMTKCGIIKPCTARPEYTVSHYNTSRDYIISCAEQSLRHFDTDYLDVFLIARASPVMNYEEMAEALSSLKQSGKIRQVGVVNFDPHQMRAMHKNIPLDVCQMELSLTHLEPLNNGSLDVCQELGIRPMSWSPIGGGSIFTNTKAGKKIEERLTKVAQKYEWTLTEMALLFLSYLPGGVIPIINQNKVDKVLESKAIYERGITNEQWFEILYANINSELS
jgi:predicted oxidoreductase